MCLKWFCYVPHTTPSNLTVSMGNYVEFQTQTKKNVWNKTKMIVLIKYFRETPCIQYLHWFQLGNFYFYPVKCVWGGSITLLASHRLILLCLRVIITNFKHAIIAIRIKLGYVSYSSVCTRGMLLIIIVHRCVRSQQSQNKINNIFT